MSNFEIFDFKTHCIQMSGFKNSVIENIDVGQNIIEDKLSPFYSQMRHYLPVYYSIGNDELIHFLANVMVEDGDRARGLLKDARKTSRNVPSFHELRRCTSENNFDSTDDVRLAKRKQSNLTTTGPPTSIPCVTSTNHSEFVSRSSHSQSHSIAESLTTSENSELRMEKQACGDNNSNNDNQNQANGGSNNNIRDTTNSNNNSNINTNENWHNGDTDDNNSITKQQSDKMKMTMKTTTRVKMIIMMLKMVFHLY